MIPFNLTPIVKYAIGGGLIVIAVLGFWLWLADVKHDAKQEGVLDERTGQFEDTFNQVEKANDTRRKIANPASRARYDQCVLDARTPANCKRLLPE
jgi:hypothetical protein